MNSCIAAPSKQRPRKKNPKREKMFLRLTVDRTRDEPCRVSMGAPAGFLPGEGSPAPPWKRYALTRSRPASKGRRMGRYRSEDGTLQVRGSGRVSGREVCQTVKRRSRAGSRHGPVKLTKAKPPEEARAPRPAGRKGVFSRRIEPRHAPFGRPGARRCHGSSLEPDFDGVSLRLDPIWI